MLKTGERAVLSDARVAAQTPAPPLGEDGRELTGPESLEALSDALLDITGEPRVRFENVKDIDVRKVGRWVLITVRHRGTNTNVLTFRIRKAWAQVLRDRLARVVDR